MNIHHIGYLVKKGPKAQAAFEARKRQARVEGEKAAVKLLLPMGMMLLVVLIILMVPAFLSF